MKKFIATLFTGLMLIASTVFADVNQVRDYLTSEKAKQDFGEEYVVNVEQLPDDVVITFIQIKKKKQLSKIEDYRYELHWAGLTIVTYQNRTVNYEVTFARRDVYDCISPDSRVFFQYILSDMSGDGTVNSHRKDFMILMENYQGTEGIDIFLLLPSEIEIQLRECGLLTLTDEQAQAEFDKELAYWLEVINDTK